MSEQTISIIIPVYNTAPYLRQCLDSVTGQTYRDIEIILVDNGSTDGSGAICDECADKDLRVQVIHKEHGTGSSARNAGLAKAGGAFISFIDSDDVISPVFMESLILPKADVAQCGYTSDLKQLKIDTKIVFESMDGFEMSEKLCTEGSLANTVLWSKLWRRECFDAIHFPESRIYEDEFVTWKTIWRAKRVARTNAPLYYYRRWTGSFMNSEAAGHSIDAVDALRERFTFYEDSGAIRLADLTKATFCYTLRGMRGNIAYTLPEQAGSLKKDLRRAYGDVMRSKELEMRKKAAVTMQMLSPSIYSACKYVSSAWHKRDRG